MTPRKPPSKSKTADDDTLWRHVTRNITPFHSDPRAPTAQTDGRAIKIVHGASVRDKSRTPGPLPPPRIDSPAAGTQPFRNADLDANTARRFKRGEMASEGRLDLHGFTLEEARRATERFITRMSAAGARCVHIVTGKGERKEHADGHGRRTIKSELPHWLGAAGLRALVLATAPARQHHGGGGAVYVLLRNRSKLKG